ncbi:MAG: MFS transporter [Alistipes sp.]|nr:MFS transporter [Alistipes sp.]
MMTEIYKRLNDSPAARWTALLIVSFTMMCGYFITDVMAPLEDLLTKSPAEGGLGWTSDEYGFFSGAYGYINVFLLMLFFGGIILDKCGVRFTGTMSSSLMLVGALLKWYALDNSFGDAQIFGYPVQVALAALGFAIFGMGAEITGITVTKIIAKWFTGHELALAMGLQVAMARIGTAAALACSLPIANKMGAASAPVLLGAALLCVGVVSFLVYCVMDKKMDASLAAAEEQEAEEGFHFSDLKVIFTNKGFWLIAVLCVLFYSGVFPFLKFATKLMIYKYGVEPELAGLIPAMLPFGTILLTPVFGSLYDRLGKGATLMISGSLMLTLVHVLFALPILNEWWFAISIMVILGIAFSLVPSAMWPAVPKIIPMKQLGSAYAIIFYIQNIGLSMVPVLIGSVIQNYATIETAEGVTYDYTIPMTIFAVFGIVAVGVALLLKHIDKKEGYGLEEPNIKK